MKQVTQRAKDGLIEVLETPAPELRPGWVLVENQVSLISAGTERTKLAVKSMNLLQKARARPDLVEKVIHRARVEGIRSAVSVTRERLSSRDALGYSSAGRVLSVGEGVEGLAPGDRVACGGAGWANHAEIVSVPKRLVASVPDHVSLDDAAYATVGAIALHAVRESQASIGERVGVIGLGLVGQLAVRILIAAGTEVVGIDLDPSAIALARGAGAIALSRDDPALSATVSDATAGIGLDSVLVCAASSSTDPVELAVDLARARGRVVVVGDVPIAPDRGPLYDKELELRVSRSYGPGRYDREYEEHGRDLPPEYVRWTEQRNLQAFVDLVARGQLDPSTLTTHRFSLDRATDAYALLAADNPPTRPFGVLLEYQPEQARSSPATRTVIRPAGGSLRIGLIGAGSFARATLLPALQQAGASLVAVTSASGLPAADVASRFGFSRTAESAEDIFEAEDIDAVVIATRHSSHASLATGALRSRKHVFVEKPLALTEDELREIEEAHAGTVLMVGFNRRFAPLTQLLQQEIGGVSNAVLSARVNAGPLSKEHWLRDPSEGGRLIGEGSHFVDLLAHLAGSPVVSVHAWALVDDELPLECSDGVAATLRCSNGSVATLLYTGGGDTRLPKERIEVFGAGMSAVLDDFRRLEIYRHGKRTVHKQSQDKGHRAEIEHFLAAINGKADPPPLASYLNSSLAAVALARSLRIGAPVDL